jgi:hypothetical protein
MNRFTQWCFKIGLWCGLIMLISAVFITAGELGAHVVDPLLPLAGRTVAIFGVGFIWIGLFLLVAAIVQLSRTWTTLSKTAKVVSVLGLGTGTFVSAYIFFWLFEEQSPPTGATRLEN